VIGDLDIPPGQSKTVTLPMGGLIPKPGVEYWLEVSFRLRRDTSWAKLGHEVAWDQMKLPDSVPPPALVVSKTKPLLVDDISDFVRIEGDYFIVMFDKLAGSLASLRCGDVELIKSPLTPHFWRAPVDNDLGYGLTNKSGVWRRAFEGAVVDSVKTTILSPKAVSVAVNHKLPKVSAAWQTVYTVCGSGDILVESHFEPSQQDLPNLPRLGMQMRMPGQFDRLTRQGRGPQETYSDRKDARVAVYSGSVGSQIADYSRPSETGNKVDVRWLTLTDAAGFGLLAVGMPTLSACALPCSTEDLEGKRHPYEIPRRDFVTLNLDWRQMGVGGDDGWGARPHEEFQIRCVPQSYAFRLRPISSMDVDIPALARQKIVLEPVSNAGSTNR
jgi:beta-galactosidase